MIDYRVYLVTDDPSRYEGNWLDKVVAAVDGGVTCVQYRDTESSREEQYRRILALQDALAGRVPVVVNNDAELAAAVRAAGVHVGQGDMPVAQVRSIVGAGCEIGLSITDIAQLPAAQECRPDCIGIGPVFDARKTKADASAAIGVEGLRAIVRATQFRSVAIGGITLDNAREVLSSGVGGLAVVSAFSKADKPNEVAKDFSMLFDDRRI